MFFAEAIHPIIKRQIKRKEILNFTHRGTHKILGPKAVRQLRLINHPELRKKEERLGATKGRKAIPGK